MSTTITCLEKIDIRRGDKDADDARLYLPDYETMMGEAVTRLCVHEGAPHPDVLDTIIHWKPLPKEQ